MSKKPESELLLLVAVIAVAVIAVNVDFGAMQESYTSALASNLETLRTVAALDQLLVRYFAEGPWLG